MLREVYAILMQASTNRPQLTLTSRGSTAAYHDEDLLRSGAYPFLHLLRLVWIGHTEPDSMRFTILAAIAAAAAAALVDGIQRLLLTASELDAAELCAACYTHEQVRQASRAGGRADGHHGLEADVVLRHQLAGQQWVQGKAILICLDLLKKLLTHQSVLHAVQGCDLSCDGPWHALQAVTHPQIILLLMYLLHESVQVVMHPTPISEAFYLPPCALGTCSCTCAKPGTYHDLNNEASVVYSH